MNDNTKNNQIIDFARKGNAVRVYLGVNGKQWGDDWNDAPYEYNAEQVYDEFIKGFKDLTFPYSDMVLEPCDGELNSEYTKQDMIERKIPCFIVVPEKVMKERYDEFDHNFSHWYQKEGVIKYYFGDEV